MSGIFRNSLVNNQTPTNETTPNKRYSFSAFCTSPGTLQDVTMENSYGVGYRSPCVSLQQYQGTTSPPTHGRSVREFEEQMATLRKENFNLKLRLYFIEESIPGYQQSNSPEGQETIMKQLIDAKVEMEILRKEIAEKQEILKEAAQAMNQMENIQKETEAKSQSVIDELKQKIQFLEMERDMEKSHNGEFMNNLLGRSEISENVNALQKIRELEGMLKQSEDKILDFQNQITKLDEILSRRDEAIKEYEEKVKELAFQNAELLETLENNEKTIVNAESQRLREEVKELKCELADKACMLQEAEEKLENRVQIHEAACRTVQKLMLKIKNQQDELSKLKSQQQSSNPTLLGLNASSENKESEAYSGSGSALVSSSELKCTGLCRSLSDSETFNELSAQQKKKYEEIIRKQEETVKSLRAEIKKKTANLQNLINKELWEKNREIERLTKQINQKNAHTTVSDVEDAGKRQQYAMTTDHAKALERNQLLQRKVDVLMQRLNTEERNDEATITQLRNEVRKAQAEAEGAEKWRRECADVCTVLSKRLEELAGFLNSLLKHKDVLGLLAADRRRAIRNAVDRSLDLSKSLNITLSISSISMVGDHSLAHLSNLSGILCDLDGIENKTFNSHEELQAQQSIDTLRAENNALKKELDKRRNADFIKKDRRSLPLSAMDNQSESEAWSEPDRKVSLARIGLEDRSASILAKEPKQLANKDEEDTDSESGTLNQSRTSSKTNRTQERIAYLEQMISQRDERILATQCQLVEADNRLKEENLRVIDMTQEIEKLKKQNDALRADIAAIGTIEALGTSQTNDPDFLLGQIEEKTRSLEKIQEERDRIALEARLAEVQIATLRADIEDLKLKHEVELTLSSEHEKRKLEELRHEMEVLIEKRLDEQEQIHRDILERDWIGRSLYEESQRQLAELKQQHLEAQRNIDYLNENEHELKQTVIDNELMMRGLKKQLDESTLQASKAVLERSKALNDKLQLEKRLQELTQQQSIQEKERAALQHQLMQSESKLQKMQEQISRQQASHSNSNTNEAFPQSGGYTSEEVQQRTNGATAGKAGVGGVVGQRIAAIDTQRQGNSSPDLGIESDAGRVSSVELSNAQRPLLKTVELSSSSSQKRSSVEEEIGEHDTDENDMQAANVVELTPATANALAPVSHDCAKVEQENAELRRKLIRTKRAFEDTYMKLRIANQKKALIEKDIKNQILKTHNVLKNVRSNMDN